MRPVLKSRFWRSSQRGTPLQSFGVWFRFSASHSIAMKTWRKFFTALAASTSLSCGSGHAVLQITAPATVVSGQPFDATVTAMYNGQRDTIIDGPIHFTTTDEAASLPTLYVFTAADAGSHTFTLTLVTPGNQTITASDYDATPISGSANVAVSPSDGSGGSAFPANQTN